MNDQSIACKREDIEALVPIYDRYSVNDYGDTIDFLSNGTTAHSFLDIEEYYCDGCGEYFTPTKRYDDEALSKAWHAALDHLTVSDSAEVSGSRG